MSKADLKVWGGFECTRARLRDDYRDQFVETGHHARPGDLEAAYALGMRTIRYPALWEGISPDRPDACVWHWHDARFAQLRALNIRPIVGLVHHGSGPRYTSLLDPHFPNLLAKHALNVAGRFPWIEDFTPVNEPLTTARFSGLYGHWYPHARDMGSFLRMTVVQCKATLLAMRAIRQVTPHARLVQTEDLGKTWSSPALKYQADYENERRWLSLDLLCGRVDRHHVFHAVLLAHGVLEADLDLLQDGDATPDVIGINHYLTSERFLDTETHRYHAHLHGENAYQRYADVEAHRIAPPLPGLGSEARLMEVWRRYGRPLAVTEAHHGCTREEQVRWLMEVWEGALAARARDADVRAVTVWSLAGAVDWASLLSERQNHYEPGALDVRAPSPRLTMVARATASLATTGAFTHPVLDEKGWWHRPDRFYNARQADHPSKSSSRPILILGGSGTLGSALQRICAVRGLPVYAPRRAEIDLCDRKALANVLATVRPWAVINAAGYVRVAEAERERDLCMRANVEGAQTIASLCTENDIPLLVYSTDRVFDGRLGRPYVEGDRVNPIDTYGESKAILEAWLQEHCPRVLTVRTSAFFGPWDTSNFAYGTLRAISAGEPVHADPDVAISPTYVPDLAHASLDLMLDGEHGLWHLANAGETTWSAFARDVARAFDLPANTDRHPARPKVSTALGSERGWIMPTLENALMRFSRDCRPDWRAWQAAAE